MEKIVHTLTRYLEKNPGDLEKMIFVAGPRQVGKTTLLKSWPKTFGSARAFYLLKSGVKISFFRPEISTS